MTTMTDAATRERALDTAESFIVRAPAGSGKTGLLTQRVLALLATVDEPEQIVAMTFTRKAATEMKQRLLEALASVASAVPPKDDFDARNRDLAGVAMRRSVERGWSLTDNPARLRIQTIDSFAQSLARQLPVTLGLGAVLRVNEEPQKLYAAAASATLATVEDGDATAADVATLLRHLDNDVGRVEGLLAAMLAKRDQWLRHATQLDRASLEAALKRGVERALGDLCARLPAGQCDELVELARYAAENVDEMHALARCRELAEIPDAECEALPAWRALAELMLVKGKGRFRRSFTKTSGFPFEQRGTGSTKKQRIEALALSLAATRDLADSLHAIRLLPEPRYSDAQWVALGAITRLLVRATAELKLVFAARGEVDFAEMTIAAAQALGQAATPSDLALALDARLTHVLIDEFQDTSISQFVLIERLVADWTVGDGRTLFVVGDPMQSIYRFRDAEVGLFVRAWNDGVGPVILHRLQLRNNFRSQPALVEWVNESFAQMLPAASDISVGAIAFEAADAVSDARPNDAVTVHALADESAAGEAQRVVSLVHQLRTNEPGSSIAILFRARTDLVEIVPALRAAALPYTAVEIDALDARPWVRDLLALTRALDHLADRVAWLAVLRAPWCGLALADLGALIESGDGHSNSRATVWSLISAESAHTLANLSVEGRAGIERVRHVMQRALELDGRESLRTKVEQVWWSLGGPACVSDPAALADAQRYLDRLAVHEEETVGALDLAQFERSLRELYATADPAADPNLVLMTIYKAKGLEFDHVIVPALARRPRNDRADLLRWLELPLASGRELLVAPINAAGQDADPVYGWIQRLSDVRQRHEMDRLLYVAATRARRQLHWVTCVTSKGGKLRPAVRASLLSRLTSVFASDMQAAVERSATLPRPAPEKVAPAFDQSLQRLRPDWMMPLPPRSITWLARDAAIDAGETIEFSWAGEAARRIGVVVHRWLQTMADDGLLGWSEQRVNGLAPIIERELAAGGLAGEELAAAKTRVQAALANAVFDPRARWLLGHHSEARNEWRLTLRDMRGARRVIIDRAFRDADGLQWIVDYKTGVHEGADAEGFLDRERLRYAGQLQAYAQALGGADQLGLYFPLLSGWRSWPREE